MTPSSPREAHVRVQENLTPGRGQTWRNHVNPRYIARSLSVFALRDDTAEDAAPRYLSFRGGEASTPRNPTDGEESHEEECADSSTTIFRSLVRRERCNLTRSGR